MKKKIDKICNLYIKTTYNNIIISLTNLLGEVKIWSSSGKMKFKGSKKNTSYASKTTCKDVIKKAIKMGLKKVHIYLKGLGLGKESAIKVVYNLGIKILSIKDVTPVPHNGCRPSKKRRI